tara:strand:+ start:183 stop:998 length:816 start_codon:yes stop_codon:yes gene_type:complete
MKKQKPILKEPDDLSSFTFVSSFDSRKKSKKKLIDIKLNQEVDIKKGKSKYILRNPNKLKIRKTIKEPKTGNVFKELGLGLSVADIPPGDSALIGEVETNTIYYPSLGSLTPVSARGSSNRLLRQYISTERPKTRTNKKSGRIAIQKEQNPKEIMYEILSTEILQEYIDKGELILEELPKAVSLLEFINDSHPFFSGNPKKTVPKTPPKKKRPEEAKPPSKLIKLDKKSNQTTSKLQKLERQTISEGVPKKIPKTPKRIPKTPKTPKRENY